METASHETYKIHERNIPPYIYVNKPYATLDVGILHLTHLVYDELGGEVLRELHLGDQPRGAVGNGLSHTNSNEVGCRTEVSG